MKNLEQLKEQYKKLGEEIERLEKDEPWHPEESELIYFVYTDGLVGGVRWYYSDVNWTMLRIGNCFRTEEEAKLRAAQYRAFMKMMKHADGGESINSYSSEDGSFDQYNVSTMYPEHPIWFSTKEKAQAALEELTDEEKNAWFKGML